MGLICNLKTQFCEALELVFAMCESIDNEPLSQLCGFVPNTTQYPIDFENFKKLSLIKVWGQEIKMMDDDDSKLVW